MTQVASAGDYSGWRWKRTSSGVCGRREGGDRKNIGEERKGKWWWDPMLGRHANLAPKPLRMGD
jgi:hypothetical protein